MPEVLQAPMNQLLIAVTSVALVLLISCFRKVKTDATTREGGTEALKQIQEWSKWMAGIQTAGFGVLALLVLNKDASALRAITDFQRFVAICGFVHLGGALFCTAWLLSALPSQSIRLHAAVTTDERAAEFDVYEQPLFGWSTRLKLAYMMTVLHWLWVVGLLALAAYCVSLLFTPSHPLGDAAQNVNPTIECKAQNVCVAR